MSNERIRLELCHNLWQGDYKKVLCVCSAAMLRSVTAAVVLSQEPFNFNTRAAGLEEYALIPVDDVLIEWADEIVCMDSTQKQFLQKMNSYKPIICLEIPDTFGYRDPQLVKLITDKYNTKSGEKR